MADTCPLCHLGQIVPSPYPDALECTECKVGFGQKTGFERLGRIPCLNPNCRRTAAQDKFPGSTNIICGKCWKVLPERMRKRWKQLNARWKKIERAMRKRSTPGPVWDRIVDRLDAAWLRLEGEIRHYFTASDQPIGLEDFLKEIGQ